MTTKELDEISMDIIQQVNVRRSDYETGLIKLVLGRDEETYNIHSGLITFPKKESEVQAETFDYGNLILVAELFKLEQTEILVRELLEKKTISLANYKSILAEGDFMPLEHYPSHTGYGYMYSEWPRHHSNYRLTKQNVRIPNQPLAKPGLPVYPDGTKAISDFLGLRSTNLPSSIIFEIPDYKLRISNLTISGKDVKLEAESAIPYEDIIVCFYADWVTHSVYVVERYYAMHSPELIMKEGYVEYSFENDFEYILGLIMDRDSGEILDYRGYNFGYGPQEGVTIELQELEVREIIRRGENLHVELKQNMENSEGILRTVIAFANTKGGRIFLGVSDDTRIIGYKPENKDQITNLITGNIDPLPDFEISHTSINDKPITIIDVAEGDNKPYSHRELGFFIRSTGTNRSATRTEMDAIYDERRGRSARLSAY